MKINQVMIFVHDLKEAKKFYHDILRIGIEVDLSKELGMLIMENEGCIFTIHEEFAKRPHDNGRKISVTFAVDDIKKEVRRLKEIGVPLWGEIEESPVHWYQAIIDPSGNMVELGQYKD